MQNAPSDMQELLDLHEKLTTDWRAAFVDGAAFSEKSEAGSEWTQRYNRYEYLRRVLEREGKDPDWTLGAVYGVTEAIGPATPDGMEQLLGQK